MELDNTEVTRRDKCPDPTEAAYWEAKYPSLTEVLGAMPGLTLVQVCLELALTAGEYTNMTDDDVLAEFVNMRVRWPLLERNELTY